MAPTDLAGGPELAARIDDLLADGGPFAVLGARAELSDVDPTVVDTVAERLRTLVRGTDLLGLVAPSTFVLVAAGSDAESAGLVAERMKQAFQMPLEVQGRVVSLVVDQSTLVVRPEDLTPGAPPALGERRGQPVGAATPTDGASALADVLAQLDDRS